MPFHEAPCVELGAAPRTPSVIASPSPSEISSTSSSEPQNVRATPLFRALAMRPPDPEQPPGQDELERRLPGYRRIVIPRELTLIELLKQSSGVTTDEEVLRIREAKLRVVAERVGLRRLHVLAPRLRSLTLDGSAISSLRDLGIGLVHLKFLSVNRCGLTSLDGIWGLGTLRELNAAGNRLHDLNPLAVLQKLHTLNLAQNPIEESSRLWTLGVCSSLRRIVLRGTPLSDLQHYTSLVTSALPMLTHLDDRPLQDDNADENLSLEASSDSEAGVSDIEEDQVVTNKQTNFDDVQPGPSHQGKADVNVPEIELKRERTFRRPATTECAGTRPRVRLPQRPKTAVERTTDKLTKLHIMHTLLDDEWHSSASGSKLTSNAPVCGNLARALRRTKNSRNSSTSSIRTEETMEQACRAVAAEIPMTLSADVWEKFKKDTGIEIDLDFNERPKGEDPNRVIEQLEQIERETMERLNNDNPDSNFTRNVFKFSTDPSRIFSSNINDTELWREIEDLAVPDVQNDVDELYIASNVRFAVDE
ncbi:uncharacterized protein LOC123691741 isoform X2 [Colias croceus]|uniref:uncharacterized protein LOC123691741 isoform X2 n=1 Tax=Colias crocea TaxID=72248 RepID=UPI001E27D620|nr:uncharacterized protein LOC123691741 isoform X2 [Colias croceus]